MIAQVLSKYGIELTVLIYIFLAVSLVAFICIITYVSKKGKFTRLAIIALVIFSIIFGLTLDALLTSLLMF